MTEAQQDIPERLVVTIHHGLDSFTLTPVRKILDEPTAIDGRWAGPAGFDRSRPERLIWFSFGWYKELDGTDYDGLGRIAARIGAHLAGIAAAGDEGWGSEAAYVYGLPVVEPRFSFEVLPEPR